MGDKSPKSTNKKAHQKEVATAAAAKKKKAAEDAKHVVPVKKK